MSTLVSILAHSNPQLSYIAVGYGLFFASFGVRWMYQNLTESKERVQGRLPFLESKVQKSSLQCL